jgi:hypothetical protein
MAARAGAPAAKIESGIRPVDFHLVYHAEQFAKPASRPSMMGKPGEIFRRQLVDRLSGKTAERHDGPSDFRQVGAGAEAKRGCFVGHERFRWP